MIWSVSMLERRSGTPMPVWVVKASISGPSREVAGSSGESAACREGAGGGRLSRREARRTFLDGPLQILGAREGAAHGCRGGDQRGDEVGAAALALTALEVAVRRRRATLPGKIG